MNTTPTCPVCGGHEFEIPVTQTVRVAFEGAEHEVVDQAYGDLEWDDDTKVECLCGHSAPLKEMVAA